MDFQFELNFDDVFEGHIKNEDTTFAEETLNISNEEIKIKEPPLSLYDFRKDENEEDKSSLDLKPDVDIALKPEENHDTSLGMQDSSINEQICQSVNDVANPFLSADKNNEVVIKKEPIEDEFIDNKEPPLLENIKEEVHWEEEISMQVENESPSKEKNVSANEPRSATPKKNLTDTSINTKRKGRVCFTKKEEENLLEGVKKYGFGCWAKILKNYHFNPCRANVSLKDKYRTLQNQGKV
uniref:Uncharacterized protein n=1 Tax=Clytia hemisphaerica TaxID=252671 RepID=A0A7M5XG04_9CNID